MSPLSVAVIVLNYRGEQVLPRCLASLELAIGPQDRVLIVDNGHEETLMAAMRSRYPWVEVIRTEANGGFAAGMNFGIRQLLEHGEFDAFWLLNNDASVAPDALGQLKQALTECGGRALFSPAIISTEQQTPWFAGGRIDFFRMRTKHEQSFISEHTPYETGFLTGCALFIPREAMASIGLLDERYFLYYEDAAYSLQAARAGLKLWVIPEARVSHSEESRENPTKTYWLVRSGVEFFLRESRGLWWLWVRCVLVLRQLKNWVEVRYRPRPVADEVKRAYTDVSL